MRALRLTVAALAVGLACIPAPHASASSTQESILMDDSLFVYGDAPQVDARMAEAKALGFDRVRVSVQWRLLAPNAGSEEKPSGDSSDPSWYGQGKWDRYDRIAQLAAKHGLGVLFSVTGPSPLWVTGTPDQNRTDVAETWAPDAGEYGK
ncbi:MAG: polysaccharide biosynthesis protein PslG, partial [Thermoleophilaceae bacterium]|nr:polysaccharide biosynthesis protein PslG [Thermoleophilaceae bacterium]